MKGKPSLLPLVDARDFRALFVGELGWNNPDRPPVHVEVEGSPYSIQQVAGYRGLRIWLCDQVPPRKVQQSIDRVLGQESTERLVIFADEQSQEWRWPRRKQTGSVNAKLMSHPHFVGEPNQQLDQRLRAIQLDIDQEPSVNEVLVRMREAFDAETEAESIRAARLMGTLYEELADSGYEDDDATQLLARLLFLLFGDDSRMWRQGLFARYVEATPAANLHTALESLFEVVDQPESDQPGHLEDPRGSFPYINGGLFADSMNLKELSQGFHDALVDACRFDWSVISPAIFGSMFQTVKDKEARRTGGEHYTTEENILRTLDPLFLEEYWDRLERAWDDKGQLTKLQTELGKLRVMDPACGCGNFLVVAYRELRAIELEILKRRRDLDEMDDRKRKRNLSQMTTDITNYLEVTLDHFYGIEIEAWPARIAEVALLIADQQANMRMADEFGAAPDRLPIRVTPHIVHDNALAIDWEQLMPPTKDAVIVGNPPFVGQYTKTREQTEDTKRVWGERYNGYLDYVTCWYAKAIDYYDNLPGRWAFVSTNSICQGEAVEFLWRPILDAGWRCRFAHRSFRWVTEAPAGAAVHVSILGFDKAKSPRPILWTYGENGLGEPNQINCSLINPYLVADAPGVLVSSRGVPVSASLPPVVYGNKPTDGGNFTVKGEDLEQVRGDPLAAQYLRRLVGARELIHDRERWCLWLVEATQQEIRASETLRSRVDAVKRMRSASSKAATRSKASTPHLFDEIRQPETSYLAIPAHVGEDRPFYTPARFGPEVICSNANFMVADPDGLVLGVLSSSMFIEWMRAIGGRIKSDLRFSNTFVYNNFPLPELSGTQTEDLTAAALKVAEVRASHDGKSLATLYKPGKVPRDLLEAHREVDRIIDRVFGLRRDATAHDRQRLLLRHYAKRADPEFDID